MKSTSSLLEIWAVSNRSTFGEHRTGALDIQLMRPLARWSSRVMPATLQLLMRHKSIETTLKYYVTKTPTTWPTSFGRRIWV